MRIFVAGATGVIGRRVVPLLEGAGHDVTAVARSESARAMIVRHGATPATVDLFDPPAVRDAVAGHDVVINMATRIPPSSRAFLPGAWRENDRIRRQASRNLVDAAISAGASRFIQESFVGLYPDRRDEWTDENVEPHPAPHARSALDAEGHAARFSESGGTGVVLRFAYFYGPDSSYTIDTVRFARKGIAPTFGRPDGFISSISLDDAAAAVLAALAVQAGIYNVSDDEPLTRRDHFAALADALGVRMPWLAPPWAAKLFGSVGETVSRSQRLSNGKFRTATGWAPRWVSVTEGWPAVVAEMGERP